MKMLMGCTGAKALQSWMFMPTLPTDLGMQYFTLCTLLRDMLDNTLFQSTFNALCD